MSRTRIEPLGVPETEYNDYADSEQARREPKGLDRWLVAQITTKLGSASPVRLVLWDEPDVTPRDGTVVVRVLSRKALMQLVVNPDLHFGDLYSSGMITLEEALRGSTNPDEFRLRLAGIQNTTAMAKEEMEKMSGVVQLQEMLIRN